MGDIGLRVGMGYDSHRLVEGRPLVLGGVTVPFDRGPLGHSDGDALVHAVIDAILGAMGEGDIGRMFPDTDPQYKGIDSMALLARTTALARERGWAVQWVDATVVIERPRLAPYIEAMRERIASAGILGVSVKAKSDEGMGFVGTGEGIAAHAVCLLTRLK